MTHCIARRDFISKVFMAVVVLPMLTNRKAKAWLVEAIVAMVILTVGAVIICKLLGLCRKLNNPKKPDKDDNASAAPNAPAGVSPVLLPIDALLGDQHFGTIDDQSDDFKTPSGTFYTGMMAVKVESSSDLNNWSPAGSFTAWFADDYALVSQVNPDGTKYITTVANWKSTGIPAFTVAYTSVKQGQFFRTAPNL